MDTNRLPHCTSAGCSVSSDSLAACPDCGLALCASCALGHDCAPRLEASLQAAAAILERRGGQAVQRRAVWSAAGRLFGLALATWSVGAGDRL
jgi:hypothetical protein